MRELPIFVIGGASVDQQELTYSTDDNDDESCSLLRQLELKTTKIFLFTIIPLLLFPLPVLIFFIPCFHSSHPAKYCNDLSPIFF